MWISSFRLGDFHDRSLSRGQKLSRRASEERGYKTLSDSSPRVLASQPWFLFQIEPDFHLLSQTHEWSCTEDSVCVFLPVSKLISGSIQSLRSFAQSR